MFSGFQLRSDDPSVLREIILEIQQVSVATAQSGKQVANSRMTYMLDTIYDLKNNRSRGSVDVEVEHSKVMKKFVSGVRARSSSSDSALRVEWSELTKSEKAGRWWVVGAPWQRDGGKTVTDEDEEGGKGKVSLAKIAATKAANDSVVDEKLLGKLTKLAKKYHMNTVSTYVCICVSVLPL